jgi:hypothetical protein
VAGYTSEYKLMSDSLDMTRLLNNARVRLPGALDTAIRWEFYEAVNEFLQESNIWQQDIPLSVDTTTATWVLPDPPVTPCSIHRLWSIKGSDGLQRTGSMQVPGTIILDAIPQQADTYTVTVVTTVSDPVDTDSNPELPAWIMSKYCNDLTGGVIGRMMTQVAKPYSNTTMAVYYMKRFQSAISKASVESRHQNIFGAQRWRFPGGFQTRKTQPWLGPV